MTPRHEAWCQESSGGYNRVAYENTETEVKSTNADGVPGFHPFARRFYFGTIKQHWYRLPSGSKHYMPNQLPSYLRLLRRRSALTQAELGALFGLTPTTITKYESLMRTPGTEVLVGCEFVFGASAAEVFPHIGSTVGRSVHTRAEQLLDELAECKRAATSAKRDFIKLIIERLERQHYDA